MPMPPKKTLTIALSAAEHAHWRFLAARFAATAITGRTAGEPSIRRLIVEIGRGKFALSSKASHGNRRAPSKEKRARRGARTIAGTSIPPWWPRDESGGIEAMLPLAGLSPQILAEARALGLQEIDGDLHPPAEWWRQGECKMNNE